jgi:uncharacterized integral membrane protein
VFKIITLIIVCYILIGSLFIAIIGNAAPISIQAQYGVAPNIDGVIDRADNEWNNAVKNSTYLYPNMTNPENGLPINLWVLQTAKNLYLSVQFQLEDHNSSEYAHEFIGILISATGGQNDFVDAKVVQFNNLSRGDYNYTDYYIENELFYKDTIQNGNGAAKLDGNDITYEFALPIRNNESDVEDSYLNYGPGNPQKVYKIVFGTALISFDDFLLQNEVTIELQFPPYIPPLSITEIVILTLNIVIFGTIGVTFAFYVYRITQLKKEVKRIKK